jgi:hypothetical protein
LAFSWHADPLDDAMASGGGRSMQVSAIVRDLLARVLELPAAERGQVFDELYESLVGHDEFDVLRDELERRGDLISRRRSAAQQSVAQGSIL